MGFFLPLVGTGLTAAGGFVVRQVAKRPILSAAGAIIGYQFVNKDDDTNELLIGSKESEMLLLPVL